MDPTDNNSFDNLKAGAVGGGAVLTAQYGIKQAPAIKAKTVNEAKKLVAETKDLGAILKNQGAKFHESGNEKLRTVGKAIGKIKNTGLEYVVKLGKNFAQYLRDKANLAKSGGVYVKDNVKKIGAGVGG